MCMVQESIQELRDRPQMWSEFPWRDLHDSVYVVWEPRIREWLLRSNDDKARLAGMISEDV